MKKLPYLLVLTGLISAPLAAMAEDSPLTGNFGLATDYVFRGISQSQHKPEVSGGFDYTHSSGLYVGTWFSNQDWVNAGGSKTNSSLEWDVYGGYRGSLPADFGYDVGLIHYDYPGDRSGHAAGIPTPDTTEAYVSLSWKFLSVKYSNAISKYFIAWGDDGSGGNSQIKTQGSDYLELNANYDMGGGWGLIGHVGHQRVKHASQIETDYGLTSSPSYNDWKVGVSKDIGYGAVTLAYSDTSAKGSGAADAYHWNGKDVSKGVLALSYSKSF
jgi:uncharacterized protein (TIGR02001 family)